MNNRRSSTNTPVFLKKLQRPGRNRFYELCAFIWRALKLLIENHMINRLLLAEQYSIDLVVVQLASSSQFEVLSRFWRNELYGVTEERAAKAVYCCKSLFLCIFLMAFFSPAAFLKLLVHSCGSGREWKVVPAERIQSVTFTHSC